MDLLISQFMVFIYMTIFGFLLAGFFRFYSLYIREWFKNIPVISNLLDLMFGIASGVFGFLILLKINWGEFRFYVFFAIILGVFFYYIVIIHRKKGD